MVWPSRKKSATREMSAASTPCLMSSSALMRVLFLTPRFEKDLRAVPSQIQLLANATTQKLILDPRDKQLNTKKLIGIHPPVWRVRLGDYRLIYTFTKDEVTLHRIRHRKDVYESF